MAEKIILDTPDYTVYEDKPAPGIVNTRIEAKPGTAAANADALRARAEQFLAANIAFAGATLAQRQAQTDAHILRLTREASLLIRGFLNLYDDTAGT